MSLNTPTGCTTHSASIAHPLHHGLVTVRHIDNLKSLVGVNKLLCKVCDYLETYLVTPFAFSV